MLADSSIERHPEFGCLIEGTRDVAVDAALGKERPEVLKAGHGVRLGEVAFEQCFDGGRAQALKVIKDLLASVVALLTVRLKRASHRMFSSARSRIRNSSWTRNCHPSFLA